MHDRCICAKCAIHTCGILICLLTSAYPAVGDETSNREARRLFDEGFRWLEKENYLEALASFRASYALKEKAIVLYNMGMCEKALSHDVEALLLLREYLKQSGDSPKPDMRGQAREAIRSLEASVGMLNVTDPPEGSKVTLDQEKPITLPLEALLPVSPGKHDVRIEADGFKAFHTVITARPGETITVRAELVPRDAQIRVRCDEGARGEVLVDDIPVGACPYSGPIAAGGHTVTVEMPHKAAHVERVRVSPGEHAEINVVPKVAPPVSPAHTRPLEASIEDNGVEVSVSRKSDNEKRRHVSYLAGGIAAIAAGVGFGGVGLVFNIRGVKHNDKKEAIEDIWNPENPDPDDRETHRQLTEETLPTDFAWTVAGYTAAAAALGTGIALLIVDGKRKRTEEKPSYARITPSGFIVTF